MQLCENVNEGKQWTQPTSAMSGLQAACAAKEKPIWAGLETQPDVAIQGESTSNREMHVIPSLNWFTHNKSRHD